VISGKPPFPYSDRGKNSEFAVFSSRRFLLRFTTPAMRPFPGTHFRWLTLLFFNTLTALSVVAAPVSYNRDVKPILSDHCFNCHGQDEKSRKGKLRLDVRDEAMRGGKSGKAAVVPGKPDQSELLLRVLTHDEDDIMPPADEKKPLSEGQISILKEWIKSGAEYQGHWAFVPPTKAAVALSPRKSSPKASATIDAFIRARLAREKFSPGKKASPETLLRRLALDLTGIPPTPTEVDTFLESYKKNPEKGYSEAVDRLLASPRYAEKWARWWMDAARYADSDGYEKDLPREQWLWRDWVLDALHKDMPYDKFIVEQIAGDLLPGATQPQRIATGFLRNGMINEEGAIINEQYRLEGMFDRMDTIGKSVLGLTLQCAQCHTHKYDPISHEEYYGLFAFLNNTYETTSWIYSDKQLEKLQQIEKAVALNQQEVKRAVPDWKSRLQLWEDKMRAQKVTWNYLDPIENEWVGGLSHPEKQKDKSILTLGFRPTVGELWVTGITTQTNLTGLRIEALTHGDLPFNGPGRSYKGTFAVSELYVEAVPLSVAGANTNHAAEIKKGLIKIPLTNAIADIEAPEQPIDPKFRKKDKEDKRRVGPAKFLIDGSDDTAWSADLGPGRRNHDSQVVMQFATNQWGAREGTLLKVWMKFRHGGDDAHGRDNNFLGRFRLSLTADENPLVDTLPAAVRAALEVPASQRSDLQHQLIFAAWRKAEPELKELNEKLAGIYKDYPEGESVLNVTERDREWVRTTPIYDRGNWQKPGRLVEPKTPAFLHPLPATAEPNRLTFAQWLVDPRSPTTARVLVNRTWQAIFGTGLVETSEDFGVRSEEPSHPELLDTLAVQLMEGSLAGAGKPWSLKSLIRTIVLSETYQQDSRVTAELLEKDPKNRLLARGPRFRGEAELVRDIALSASGLLHEQVGGRSFYPPVPESLFALNFVKIDWTPAPAPERYRRSVYMFRRRSMPDPVMSSFDAPNADFSCVRRPRSNTPLAALTSLNEPVFVEAAQALALRVLKEGGATDESRAAYAFRLCTGRKPRAAEQAAMLQLLRGQEGRLAEGWLTAKDVAAGDAALPKLPEGTTPRQLAGWTIVSRVLLNLDETISKN
jgi:hypothetical protein